MIGFCIDTIKHKPNLLCRIGFHKAAKYVMARKGNDYYFVCKRCGKWLPIVKE